MPYWACVLVVAVACYGTLFASMLILTPVIKIVGRNVTHSIWENASQELAPRMKTLYSFGKAIFVEPVDIRRSTPDVEHESHEPVQRVVKSAIQKTVVVTEVSETSG